MTRQGRVRIVLVGSGPRGISALERLALTAMRRPELPTELFVVDAAELGAGRIWRIGQEPIFLMNTVVSQVTMFSGPEDGPVSRPGAGPTLQAWLQREWGGDGVQWGANTYASRAAYGAYLRHCYRAFLAVLRETVPTTEIEDEVVAVEGLRDGFTVRLAEGGQIDDVDVVILATGHHRPRPAGQASGSGSAARSTRTRRLPPDSAADLPLHRIAPGETVGIVGMGLGFYDIVAALTEGRGGSFRETGEGLAYVTSGREPKLVAGSRSGLPVLARAVDQKVAGTHRAAFMTGDALAAARARALARRGSRELDFGADVMPLLQAEMEHSYFAASVRSRRGPTEAERFLAEHARVRRPGAPAPAALLAAFGLEDEPPFDFHNGARPFEGRSFARHEDFTSTLKAHLRRDVEEARRGNRTSPLKAAYDTLRDVRDTIRQAVEHSGLTTRSRRDFLNDFVPACSLLSAGPPIRRLRELLALLQSGLLELAGPGATFSEVGSDCRLEATSTASPSFRRALDYLVDSRIPKPSCQQDSSRLFAQLQASGALRAFRPRGDESEGEGVDVSTKGGRIIGTSGRETPGLFVLGLPTEGARWFTQVGSATPGVDSRFTRDAAEVVDAVWSYCEAIVERSESLEVVL